MFLDLHAGLLFLSVCGDNSRSLLGLWMLRWHDRWVSCTAAILGVFIWKLGLGVLQWRSALSSSEKRLQRCVELTIIWSLAGRGGEGVKCLFMSPDEVILLQIVCVFLGPAEADVLLRCPWVWDSEGLLISLTDEEFLLGGALSGGLGLGWHRGGGGCGRSGTDVGLKVCRVSSETLCPADSLKEKNQWKYSKNS